MKERPDETRQADHGEISSSDIPNAHAVGDGAMGRNDEKVDDPAEVKSESEEKKEKDRSAY